MSKLLCPCGRDLVPCPGCGEDSCPECDADFGASCPYEKRRALPVSPRVWEGRAPLDCARATHEASDEGKALWDEFNREMDDLGASLE